MASLSYSHSSEELKLESLDHKWLLQRCDFFDDQADEEVWTIVLVADLSLSDTAVILSLISVEDPDILSLSNYDINILIKFSEFFKCNYLLIEYFRFFISRDLLLTIKDYFTVLCYFGIEHPIASSSLLCYCTTLNVEYSKLSSLLHSGDSSKKYAIYKFRHKVRSIIRSKAYANRMQYGTCQVGRHPIVVLPAKNFEETAYIKWGTILQCCGSVCCSLCFDWIKTRPALALPNATTCPICTVFLDINTLEYLWEYTEALEERERGNQLRVNGFIGPMPRRLPIPQTPLPQPALSNRLPYERF